jgi:hypothetical protein
MKVELHVAGSAEASNVCWCDLCRYKWQMSKYGDAFEKSQTVLKSELLEAAESADEEDTYYPIGFVYFSI